jgi:P27 family predicted phage terminase small subunit
MQGRLPKPAALKLLEGNPGHRQIPEQSEVVPAEAPDPPDHLSGIALRVWKEKASDMARAGLISKLDSENFACYCEAVATWIEAKSMVARQGAVLLAPNSGFPVQNPYVAIANRAMEQIRTFGAEFGLSPASRTRLTGGLGGQQGALFDDDPMEAYLRANELPDYSNSGGATAPAG